jgi:hypothetical protein
MRHHEASSISLASVVRHLFYVKRGMRLNVEFLLLTIVNSMLVIFVPIVEKKFRLKHGLSPSISREDGPMNYLASNLMYIAYPE